MNIRVKGDSKIFGPSNRIWQGRLGTRSIRVKLEMSVQHLHGEESWQLDIQVWRQLVDGTESRGTEGTHLKRCRPVTLFL